MFKNMISRISFSTTISFSYSKQTNTKVNLVFDVDSTLYPESLNLFQNASEQVDKYIARLMEVDEEKAHEIQMNLLTTFGSSYLGLYYNCGNLVDFVDYCNDIFEGLNTQELLEQNIRLNKRKEISEMFRSFDKERVRLFILSNSTKRHVGKVLKFFSIQEEKGIFEKIICLDDMQQKQRGESVINKPNEKAYRTAIEIAGIEPGEPVFFFLMIKQ